MESYVLTYWFQRTRTHGREWGKLTLKPGIVNHPKDARREGMRILRSGSAQEGWYDWDLHSIQERKDRS